MAKKKGSTPNEAPLFVLLQNEISRIRTYFFSILVAEESTVVVVLVLMLALSPAIAEALVVSVDIVVVLLESVVIVLSAPIVPSASLGLLLQEATKSAPATSASEKSFFMSSLIKVF